MKQKLNKKGFTLVELLVVVAIIGILAAIVLVSLNSARDRARVASLQSTLASITTLANLCVNDGGSVDGPTANTTGGGAICDPTDITAETWPALSGTNAGAPQGLENSGYQYMTVNDGMNATDIISAGDGTDAVVTCTIATGSCMRN